MDNWKEYHIKDLGTVITGNTPPTTQREYYGNEYKFIKPTDMIEGQRFVDSTEECLSDLGYQKYKKSLLPKFTPCVVTIGSLGKKMCLTDCECFTNQAVNAVIPNKNNDGIFLYYAFKATVLAYVKQLDSGTSSGRENVSKSSFSNIKITVPPLPTQQKIAGILSKYDEAIENNNKRIKLLEQMAQNLYKEWFVRFRFPDWQRAEFENGIPKGWKVVQAQDLFDITIGRTPDRKVFDYFSNNKSDYLWVSIADMKDKMFVLSSSEYLTSDAIQKVNMPMVKENTVILSFKLSVGRVAITSQLTCTNEAIAHFNTNNRQLLEYTYLYLKTFQYQDLGNTSAIGNAVNSTIIKKMKFLCPDEKVLSDFHFKSKCIFDEIKLLTYKTQNLSRQRDLLLPRLMSGKLQVLAEKTYSKVYEDRI